MRQSYRQIRARTPEHADADQAFSRGVKARDSHVCRMERWNGKRYVEHGIKASAFNPLDPSHIYNRSQIGGAMQFDLAVGIASCRDCHELYGERDDAVRVPPAREKDAWAALQDAIRNRTLKVLPPRREPPKRPATPAKVAS